MYCPKCGSEHQGSNFCVNCGTNLQIANAAETKVTVSVEQKTTIKYAGFWFRLVALISDSIVVLLILFLVNILLILVLAGIHMLIPQITVGSIGVLPNFIPGVTFLLSWWLYYAWMESSRFQATIGKMMLDIKVTDLNGDRVSFGRATGRLFGKMLSHFLYIGFIVAAFNEKKQGFHDQLSGCLVIKK